jgi:predicted nucleic acid-binding protein
MTHEQVYLLDSDFFYGLFVQPDPHHERANRVIDELEQQVTRLFVSNIILVETPSLLSKRGYHSIAKQFLSFVRTAEFDVVYVDDVIQREAERLFDAEQFEASIADCCNVVIARRLGIRKLLAFDKFYGKFDLEYLHVK